MKKRTDGLYKTTYQHDGVKKYFYAKTKAECLRKKQAYIDALQRGQLPNYTGATTVKDWMVTWLISVHPTIDESTFSHYESVTRIHIVPRFGNMPIAALQPTHIREFIADLTGRYAPNTVNHIRGVMRAAFNQAVNDDILVKSPMRGVKAPKKENVRPWVPLTPEQLKKFFSVMESDTHRLIFMMAALTGLRRSELLALRIKDIDLVNRTLTVNQKIIKENRQLVIKTKLKTKLSQRSMTLTPDLIPLIKKHILGMHQRRMADAQWNDQGLLFSSEHGRPYYPDWITRLAKDYAAAAGLPPEFTLNHLRHTNASLLLKNGADYKTVQTRLGHSTAKLTLDTYSHMMPGQDAKAAASLQGII